jgi:hypothetical protein
MYSISLPGFPFNRVTFSLGQLVTAASTSAMKMPVLAGFS